MSTKGMRMMLVMCLVGAMVAPAVASAPQEPSRETLPETFTPRGNTALFTSENFAPLHHSFENNTGDNTPEIEPMGQQIGESNGLMNSSWPMFCHDLHHTGRSPYSTADNPYVVKWRFISDWIWSSPTIANNGTIYFPSGTALYALNPNGTEKWNYNTKETIVGSTPAIDESGTIYFGTWDYSLWAINPNGTLKWWVSHFGGMIGTSPAISPNGTIYIGDINGQLTAVSPTGQVLWKYMTGSTIESAPAISDNGTIYVGSHDHYFYAINPNGTLQWRYHTGNMIVSDPSIAPDGTIYTTSEDGNLYAFNPNGTLRWQTPVGWGSLSDSAIATDGTIYVAGAALYAIYPNGSLRWTFNLGTDRWVSRCSPAVSADGTIYVGACIGDGNGGDLIAVNPDSTERWRSRISNDAILYSLAIDSDGTVYSAIEQSVSTGELVAIGRGPIIVHANGPYQGYTDTPLKFTGTAYGGITPYTFHWDFGDKTTSDQQNPTHNYTLPGNYTATFIVTDSEGNTSSDTSPVHIDWQRPQVTILKPGDYIYFFNIRIVTTDSLYGPWRPVIIGPITVRVTASEQPFGINRVEISIDHKLKATITQPPYTWTWKMPSLTTHWFSVTAYDNSGNCTTISMWATKLF